jgi:hypothetical protein
LGRRNDGRQRSKSSRSRPRDRTCIAKPSLTPASHRTFFTPKNTYSLPSSLIPAMSWANDRRRARPYGPDPAGREIRLFTIIPRVDSIEYTVSCVTSRAWIGSKSLPIWIRPGPHVISVDDEAATSSGKIPMGAYVDGLPHLQYSAISYAHKTWTNADDTRQVLVDGRATEVPRTLDLALRSLRRIIAGVTSPGTHSSPSQSHCAPACLSG